MDREGKGSGDWSDWALGLVYALLSWSVDLVSLVLCLFTKLSANLSQVSQQLFDLRLGCIPFWTMKAYFRI